MFRRVFAECPHTRSIVFARRFARPTYSEVSEALSVMGVELTTDEKTLKKKYRELVRKHHPDAGGNEATMSKITVAYERLTSLSKREREEFQQQNKSYRGGSGSFGGAYGSSGAKAYAGFSRQSEGSAGGSHQWQQGPDFARAQYAGSTRAAYSYNKGGSHSESPFRNPYDWRQHTVSMSRMPFANFFVRAIGVYLGLSFVMFVFYRRYSDWRHDDGWKASESLARHEQMEHLHKLRQELNEKVAAARDNRNHARAQDYERSKELRVMEYSQKRSMELQESEFRCWPKFDESKGMLVKKSYDPPGITYFEPGAENERRRQVAATFGETAKERYTREMAVARSEIHATDDLSAQVAGIATTRIQNILQTTPSHD
jgi:curved DNA-binding protein CbpA